MKKIFAFLSLIVVLVFVLLVPVSASSIYIPTFDYPHLNRLSGKYGFSPLVPYSSSGAWFDYEDIEPYLHISHSDAYCSLFVLLCDENYFEVIPDSSFSITFNFNEASDLVYSTSFSTSYFTLDCHYLSDYYADNVNFTISNYGSAVYYCLIPLTYSSSSSDLASQVSDIRSNFFNISIYERGYANGISDGASLSYLDGLNDGLTSSDNTTFREGYDQGKQFGQSLGEAIGYERGQADMQNDVKLYSNAVFDTVSAPFRAISNFLNFNILGINLLGVFAFIVTAVIIGFILKKLL